MARILLILGLLVAAIRVAGVVRSAQTHVGGDFAATLPGAYAEELNPRLWNSEDLRAAAGFHKRVYLYGPTQYLTLYPIVFLDSYAQIATALLIAYAPLLAVSLYLLWRAISAGERRSASSLVVVVVISLLFFPLLQAYGQREFEVVVFFAIVAATYLLVTGRAAWAGALFGYITWFKFWPIVFVGYFLVRRQFRALSLFVLVSALTLGLAHLVFGLDRFTVFNSSLTSTSGGPFWPSLIAPTDMLDPATFSYSYWHQNEAVGFCRGWSLGQQTMVNLRWGLCGLGFAHRWFPSRTVFFGLTALFALAAVAGFVRAERRDLSADDRKWRILWEVSLLTIGASLMLRAHYHYLIFLALPINALAQRYAIARSWMKLGWLAAAYVLLAAFVVPMSVWQRLFGLDLWAFYTRHVVYLYGLVILIGLLLWEYVALGAGRRERLAEPI